jgi:protein SCO1/2
MFKRVAFVILFSACSIRGTENHPAKGIVLKTDKVHRLLVVSCEAIPGYMDAMEMEFMVRKADMLAGLKPGSPVTFTIAAHGKKLYAEDIHEGTTATFESVPMAAGQLTALNNVLDPATKVLAIGQQVPDFALTDQAGASVHLAQFRGKVVALTFGYSRCPNPNYCYRLSRNLAQVEQRFHSRAGRDLVLITIMIDPEHDQGATLAQYASVSKANPAYWHFLTGPLPEIKEVAGMFGMNFWSVEGLVTHSLRTVIIDRQRHVAVTLEGNQFTAQELGDLVRTVMDRP